MTSKKQLRQGCSIIALFLFCGCTTSDKQQVITTKIFSLKSDNKCRLDTVNSYCGYIICDNDSIYYDLSFTASSLSDNLPNVAYFPPVVENLANGDTNLAHNVDTTGVIIVRRRDYDIDAYRKQSVQFKRSHGYVIKYTFPTDTVKGGIVGVYYDSVKVADNKVLKFTAFLKNPHNGNYSKARELINQIYLYPLDSTHLPLPFGTLNMP